MARGRNKRAPKPVTSPSAALGRGPKGEVAMVGHLRAALGTAARAAVHDNPLVFREAVLPLRLDTFEQAQRHHPQGTVHFAPVIEAIRAARDFADVDAWLDTVAQLLKPRDPVLVILADYLLDKRCLAAAAAACNFFARVPTAGLTYETAALAHFAFWEKNGAGAVWAMVMEARRLAITNPVGMLQQPEPRSGVWALA